MSSTDGFNEMVGRSGVLTLAVSYPRRLRLAESPRRPPFLGVVWRPPPRTRRRARGGYGRGMAVLLRNALPLDSDLQQRGGTDDTDTTGRTGGSPRGASVNVSAVPNPRAQEIRKFKRTARRDLPPRRLSLALCGEPQVDQRGHGPRVRGTSGPGADSEWARRHRARVLRKDPCSPEHGRRRACVVCGQRRSAVQLSELPRDHRLRAFRQEPGRGHREQGTGFRSVLRLTDRPEVYSRDPDDAADRDSPGYSFRFPTDDELRRSTADEQLGKRLVAEVSPLDLPCPPWSRTHRC